MSTTRKELMNGLTKAAKEMSRPSLFMRSLIAEQAGMNVTDAECIDYLLDLRQASAKELAEAMHLRKSSVTAMLDRLERTAYITREIDKNDRRRIVIKPNMATIGVRIRPFYLSYGAEFQRMTEHYTDDELVFLTTHYRRMTSLYERQIKKLRGIENTTKPLPG